MKISNRDRRRLELLLTLCVNLDDLKERLIDAEETASLDDSPKETLKDYIRVIGIASRWLSPAFKEETRGQMMWGCLAMMQRDDYLSHYERGTETDWEIAENDIPILIDLCKWWLDTGDTAPKPHHKIFR